jgi:hypothetical protein
MMGNNSPTSVLVTATNRLPASASVSESLGLRFSGVALKFEFRRGLFFERWHEMVGGTVIEACVCHYDQTKMYINCADRPYTRTEECAIHVEVTKDSLQIQIGDMVWWQGRLAFWTPADDSGRVEVKIPRRGYSGVNHPSTAPDDD